MKWCLWIMWIWVAPGCTWVSQAELDEAYDQDGDGFLPESVGGPDCDNGNAEIHPEATEICGDGLDNNCDGLIDDVGEGAITFYFDGDGDGYGLLEEATLACTKPKHYSPLSGDCDDEDAGVTEYIWFLDADDDGYGVDTVSALGCLPPNDYVPQTGDCDDANADVNPNSPEICNNGIDDNCDNSHAPCGIFGEIDLALSPKRIGNVNSELGTSLMMLNDINDDDTAEIIVSAFDEDALGALVLNGSSALEENPLYIFNGIFPQTMNMFSGPISNELPHILLGEPTNTVNDVVNAGLVTIVAQEDLSLATKTLSVNDLQISGTTELMRFGYGLTGKYSDKCGPSLAAVGAIGSSVYAEQGGAVLIFPIDTKDLSAQDAVARIDGLSAYGRTGWSLAPFIDYNGDSCADLITGGPTQGGQSQGYVHGFWGPITGNLTTGDADLLLTHEDVNGLGLDFTVGDHNGDMKEDLVVTAMEDAISGPSAGVTYVFNGPITLPMDIDDAVAVIRGGTLDLATIASLEGDLNSDGYDDLVVGAPGYNLGQGAVFIIFGPISGTYRLPDDAHAYIPGKDSGSRAGTSVSSAGDVNGDSYDDLLLSAPGYDDNRGAIYLILGSGY